MSHGGACGRPLHRITAAGDDGPVCLMHSHDPNKSVPEFHAELVSIMKSAIETAADFTNFVFPALSFNGLVFEVNCIFTSATFTHDAVFAGATFAQDADFRGATFADEADFGSATFTQDTNFTESSFDGMADFSDTKFFRQAEFRETKFGTKESLGQGLVPSSVFSRAEFFRPEAVVFYKTYLGRTLFHNCDVSKLNFQSVEWRMRKNGKWKVLEEEKNLDLTRDCLEALRPRAGSADEREYSVVATLYQQLKKSYDDRKDYWTAGDFHYGEMEMKRLSSRRQAYVCRWLHRTLGLVAWYKYASQYGESYVRPALLLASVLLTFAILFPISGLRYHADRDVDAQNGVSDFVASTYRNPIAPWDSSTRRRAQLRLLGNSGITSLNVASFQKEFTYEPLYPWGRLLALLEMLITSTLFALFLLAVRRQFRR